MNYRLEDGEAHAWVVSLEGEVRPDHPLLGWLSAAERARADRIDDPEARRCFTLARVALRGVLSGCTGVPAASLALATTPRGKPVLGDAGVEFSLSHTRGVALIGVALSPIGVDVERLRRPTQPLRIARRVMHAETVNVLERVPAHHLDVAFIDAWTQREAHAKALGGGLFHTPDTLPYHPGDPADGMFSHVTDRRDGATWSIARLAPAVEVRAAVVVRGAVDRLHVHDAQSILEPRGEP
jgi:4'-phosphopantetheinyl transferase